MEAAVALYKGSFLEGFSLPDSPAFEEWALLTREQRQRQALAALQGLADHYARRGDYERALIVYKVRADGALWVVYVKRKDEIGDRVEDKARTVLEAVDRGLPPACTCGWCRR